MSSAFSLLKSRFDWVLLALVGVLASVGLLNLYSSSIALEQNLYQTQAVWLGLGALVVGFLAALDYRFVSRWAYVGYALVLFLLLAVLFVGSTINNSTRWLNLGFTLLQPSELMKPMIVLATARYFATQDPRPGGLSLTDLIPPFALVLAPVALIMLQPDLGTSLMVLFIFLTMILFEGLTLRALAVLGISAAVSLPLGWTFLFKDYQKNRILSFLDLEKDPYGPGWQVRQALIAFGSGGLEGKGHLAGTQVQKGFVPYHESDFAAVNWAEEHGFLGMMFLLGLYILLIAWALRIARSSRDRLGVLLCVGMAAMIFWHVTVNLGMVMGMLPVVGLTLPLVSYGGSSMITNMIAIGVLFSVSLRRGEAT